MRKNKTQKGITLIALIITIVVLLILAVVSVSSIQEDGIIEYAKNVAKDYNQAVKNEQGMLDEYLEYLTGVGKATVGTKVDKISTINGEQYSAINPVIPAGFMATNSGANWNATDLAAEVKKGLVISDGTSEFVWIPVANIGEMAKVTSGTDANKRTNYEGKLYDFLIKSDGTLKATEKEEYGQSTNNNTEPSYREPANLTSSSCADNADKFTLTTIKKDWDTNYYQEAFNKMVESVIEYRGFYVGRYEMSYNTTTNKAESRAGVKSVYNDSDANDWWGLYEKATTYSTSGVVLEMIWGVPI